MEERICRLLHGCLVNLLSHCSYCWVFYCLMVGTDSSGGQSGSSLNLVTSLPSSLYMSSFDISCYSASILNNIVEWNSIDGLAWIQIVPEDGYRWAEGAWFFLSHFHPCHFLNVSCSLSSISASVSSQSSPSWWGWWGSGSCLGRRNKPCGQGLMAIASTTVKFYCAQSIYHHCNRRAGTAMWYLICKTLHNAVHMVNPYQSLHCLGYRLCVLTRRKLNSKVSTQVSAQRGIGGK